MHRLRGELSLSQSDDNRNAAEEAFQRALPISRGQKAKSLELRSAMSLSRLWDRQGKTEESRGLVYPIHAWFTEGFGTPDLEESKALLEKIS